eukprot:6212481-Pleurochrysis_carterae.AAC.1
MLSVILCMNTLLPSLLAFSTLAPVAFTAASACPETLCLVATPHDGAPLSAHDSSALLVNAFQSQTACSSVVLFALIRCCSASIWVPCSADHVAVHSLRIRSLSRTTNALCAQEFMLGAIQGPAEEARL